MFNEELVKKRLNTILSISEDTTEEKIDDIILLITNLIQQEMQGRIETQVIKKNAVECDHAGAMYPQYRIDNLGINGHDIHFGVNKCSRCGYEDYWQVDQ